ncbi:MAG: hypothetical protein JJ837_07880 [Prochlorococcus marinus XMU1428]|nr:hypothetical protein [Prochlorococcus marinus XMU1428]
MNKRISLLYKKYDYLRKKKLVVNSISKHQSRGTYKNLLETSCASGSTFFRQNSFHNEVAFIKNWEGVTIFLDAFIDKQYLNYKSDFNVALLIESKGVKPDVYKRLFDLEDHFDLILTHDAEILINFENKTRFIAADTITTNPKYYGVKKSKKIKDISFNFSNKLLTPGHKLRYKIANDNDIINNRLIDQLGSGPQGIRIPEKGEMIDPYKFSIVVENSNYPYYFTEKIMDCFISGTVPIYWGCDSIGKFFDDRGILKFSTLAELKVHLNRISDDPNRLYDSMDLAIKKNYQIAKDYLYFDDIYFLEMINYIDEKFGLKNKMYWFSVKGNEEFSNPNNIINKVIRKFR